jgi:hypothetical protein
MSKYRRLRGHRRRARCWIHAIRRREPALFAHWPLLYREYDHDEAGYRGELHEPPDSHFTRPSFRSGPGPPGDHVATLCGAINPPI